MMKELFIAALKLTKAANDYNRVHNYDAFDAPILTMWRGSRAFPFIWDSHWKSLDLTEAERARIALKMYRELNPFVFSRVQPITYVRPLRSESVTRRKLNKRTSRRAAPESRQLAAGVEPPQSDSIQETEAAPQPTLKGAKKTKRRGTKERVSEKVKARLVFFCQLRLSKALKYGVAVRETVRVFAHYEDKQEKNMLRYLRTDLRGHLNGGEDVSALRRFYTKHYSKVAHILKSLKT
jgi:hypothetical protein